MKLQKKNNFGKKTYQTIVPIPSKLVVALDINMGDMVYWQVIDKQNLKLVRTKSGNINQRYIRIFAQGHAKRLYVTLPKPLFQGMGWYLHQQFEWKIKSGSLILKKDLSPYAEYKRQNLE